MVDGTDDIDVSVGWGDLVAGSGFDVDCAEETMV